jgi:ubiquinone/menaquinone biosynthesis C-methylase UbiE
MVKKIFVRFLQKLEYGSAVSMKLVKITGKHKHEIHPKHLLKTKVWFAKRLGKQDVVLDLGCGVGQTAIEISPKVKKVVALDSDSKSLGIAKESARKKGAANINFVLFDANQNLPFPDKYFSKIIASDILEHLNRRNNALKEIARLLKPNGFLFLVVDNPDTSWKRLKKSAGLFYFADLDHKYEYPKEEIIKILKSMNFNIISCKPVTYDTPLKGLIDLAGGFSLTLYKTLRKWRSRMNDLYPKETTGYMIIASKS